MPMVLLLAMAASLLVSASLMRQNSQTFAVQRQIEDYQSHHDMLGVRAVVEQWLSRRTPRELVNLSATDEVDYRFIVTDHLDVSIWLEDGQGAMAASEAQAPEVMRETYASLLERLPEDRLGLVRGYGSHQISVHSAPREVLAALVEHDGDDFAEEIIAARERERLNDRRFFEIVGSRQDGSRDVERLRPLVTFEPSLWRIRMRTADEYGGRRFAMLAELREGRLWVHEWLEEADLAIIDRRDGATDDPERERNTRRERETRRGR